MKLSLIITTYNSEEWLKKVLFGYAVQTEADFEVIIADDGSTSKTKDLIDSFQGKFKYEIIHVWQEDAGFRKPEILNKAILKSKSDYLLFTDGDCIPKNDFIATHLKYKEKGYFLSGGYFKLPLSLSQLISEDDIKTNRCFEINWLLKNGLQRSFKVSKLINNRVFVCFMNWVSPTKKTFNGHNTSCFKSDLLAVNGFNENMQYGGLDREVGERLFNFGILAKQLRYAAICIHLEHDRKYASSEIWKKNQTIRDFNSKNNVTYIANGIFKNNEK